MQALPHHYHVSAAMVPEGIEINSAGLATIHSEPPAEFGGSGKRWSPETLMIAAVADCFLLTFKAIARASKLDYSDIKTEVEGKLDRVDGATRFTTITVRPCLVISDESLREKAEKLLHKAEKGCLISNSLNSEMKLETEIILA